MDKNQTYGAKTIVSEQADGLQTNMNIERDQADGV